MKVWKSVGAVAVYSRVRVAALLAAFAVVVAGLGFLGGMAATADDDGSSSPAPKPASSSAPERQAPDRARAGKPAAGSADRAYRRGYRKGIKAGAAGVFGRGGDLRAGAAYFVRAERGGEAGVRIGRRVRVDPGRTYWLCSGGQRLCMRTGGSE